ncbi:MAG: GDSL-type esterase/lipase family protein [Opitutaceae bacterium]|jgi:lysophospholipase L1-like esterase|nr:GDSL-type esterase/lipase family protein [Opitutaceae bacterium]
MNSSRILTLTTALAVLALNSGPLLRAGEILVKPGETVAFLGDSITQQGALSGGYVRLVADGLGVNGVPVEVVPAGVGGNKSNQMLERLEKSVLDKKPDWMTLSCGVNDVMQGTRGGVPLDEFKKNITAIVDRCQQAGVKVIMLTATQIRLPVTNSDNIKLAAYNDFLRDLAKERNLPLADVSADMAAEQGALAAARIRRSLTTDGVHMSIYGNIMMAKSVLATLGLDAKQIAAAEAAWQSIPDASHLSARVNVSISEHEALEIMAEQARKPLPALLNDLATAAAKEAAAKHPAPAK